MKQAVKWAMTEFTAVTSQSVENPFWDISPVARLSHEKSGAVQRIAGFYDGLNDRQEHVWKFRWTPSESGDWRCRIASGSESFRLDAEFDVAVAESLPGSKGMLRAHAGPRWGFTFDNGEPFLPIGDTIYNLFGGCHSGIDIEQILAHRASQGVNYVRARMQVSPYHRYPTVFSHWMNADCWPWEGSAQWPDFTGFNLDYFRSVDRTMELLTRLGIGLEVIFEAWMLEFPFNDRGRFLSEHEEHWFQYIIARYAAFPCVYIWCPVNEYDFYPGNAEKNQGREAVRWFKRLAGTVKQADPYKHPVGVHQWGHDKPISELMGDCDDLDVYLVQTNWSKEISEYDRISSLCLWIEDNLTYHVPHRDKAAFCSEFGYERLGSKGAIDFYDRMDEHHTRRGMWKAGFVGFPAVHGFNNTWGPYLTLEQDSCGTRYLQHYWRFMTEEIRFHEMLPQRQRVQSDEGMQTLESPALCLTNEDLTVVAVYFPVHGTVELKLDSAVGYRYDWFNPRTGEAIRSSACDSLVFSSPGSHKEEDVLESDWVLILRK